MNVHPHVLDHVMDTGAAARGRPFGYVRSVRVSVDGGHFRDVTYLSVMAGAVRSIFTDRVRTYRRTRELR